MKLNPILIFLILAWFLPVASADEYCNIDADDARRIYGDPQTCAKSCDGVATCSKVRLPKDGLCWKRTGCGPKIGQKKPKPKVTKKPIIDPGKTTRSAVIPTKKKEKENEQTPKSGTVTIEDFRSRGVTPVPNEKRPTPETPTQKPETLTQKPETPTQKPETLTQKPETLTQKPETPMDPALSISALQKTQLGAAGIDCLNKRFTNLSSKLDVEGKKAIQKKVTIVHLRDWVTNKKQDCPALITADTKSNDYDDYETKPAEFNPATCKWSASIPRRILQAPACGLKSKTEICSGYVDCEDKKKAKFTNFITCGVEDCTEAGAVKCAESEMSLVKRPADEEKQYIKTGLKEIILGETK